MFKEDISKEELAAINSRVFEKKVYIVDNEEQLMNVCSILRESEILGFDTETKPNFKKGRFNKVALLQLSNRDSAFIFRLHKLGIPDCLAELLSSNAHKKIGVAIHDDIKALKKVRPFDANGFVELQSYVENFGIKSKSLKKLSALILGFSISKGQRLSNWEKDPLSEAQIRYAATDAWVCYEIYVKLLQQN